MIALALFLGKGLPAWRIWFHEAQTAARELGGNAATGDHLIRSLPVLRDSLRARETRRTAIESVIVSGDSPGAAAAALASVVDDAASDAGVTLGGLEPRADTGFPTLGTPNVRKPRSPLITVTVHGDMTGDVVAILDFLANLEHGPLLLTVRDLSITQAAPMAPPRQMETLHGEFRVVGLARRAVALRGAGQSIAAPATSSTIANGRIRAQ